MEHTLRQRAEVYAQLANVADLGAVEQWQKEKLIADVRAAGMLETTPIFSPTKGKNENRKIAASWGRPQVPAEWIPIFRVHPWAYKFINQLLDSGKCDVRDFHRNDMLRPVIWSLENDRVKSSYDPADLGDKQLLVDLVRVITQRADPFPFRRCSLCRKIFVRFGKRIFCSKQCTDKSVGSRADYMRDYMKNVFRKKAKAKRNS